MRESFVSCPRLTVVVAVVLLLLLPAVLLLLLLLGCFCLHFKGI